MTLTPVHVVLAAGFLLTAALTGLAIRAHLRSRAAQHDNAQQRLARAQDQAIRIVSNDMPWPSGATPCDHEDGWCTGECRPRGKHHAVWSVPLDDQPAAVILAVVTDVQRRQK